MMLQVLTTKIAQMIQIVLGKVPPLNLSKIQVMTRDKGITTLNIEDHPLKQAVHVCSIPIAVLLQAPKMTHHTFRQYPLNQGNYLQVTRVMTMSVSNHRLQLPQPVLQTYSGMIIYQTKKRQNNFQAQSNRKLVIHY